MYDTPSTYEQFWHQLAAKSGLTDPNVDLKQTGRSALTNFGVHSLAAIPEGLAFLGESALFGAPQVAAGRGWAPGAPSVELPGMARNVGVWADELSQWAQNRQGIDQSKVARPLSDAAGTVGDFVSPLEALGVVKGVKALRAARSAPDTVDAGRRSLFTGFGARPAPQPATAAITSPLPASSGMTRRDFNTKVAAGTAGAMMGGKLLDVLQGGGAAGNLSEAATAIAQPYTTRFAAAGTDAVRKLVAKFYNTNDKIMSYNFSKLAPEEQNALREKIVREYDDMREAMLELQHRGEIDTGPNWDTPGQIDKLDLYEDADGGTNYLFRDDMRERAYEMWSHPREDDVERGIKFAKEFHGNELPNGNYHFGELMGYYDGPREPSGFEMAPETIEALMKAGYTPGDEYKYFSSKVRPDKPFAHFDYDTFAKIEEQARNYKPTSEIAKTWSNRDLLEMLDHSLPPDPRYANNPYASNKSTQVLREEWRRRGLPVLPDGTPDINTSNYAGRKVFDPRYSLW